jgi:hypothetical protein
MRKLSLVKVTEKWKSESHFKDDTFIYLGEIPNMKGHGVFIGHKTGKIYSGYHTERFRELTDEET